VFATGSGIGYALGPKGGFLVGFILIAIVIGFIIRADFDHFRQIYKQSRQLVESDDTDNWTEERADKILARDGTLSENMTPDEFETLLVDEHDNTPKPQQAAQKFIESWLEHLLRETRRGDATWSERGDQLICEKHTQEYEWRTEIKYYDLSYGSHYMVEVTTHLESLSLRLGEDHDTIENLYERARQQIDIAQSETIQELHRHIPSDT
jgi:hypothetical protein